MDYVKTYLEDTAQITLTLKPEHIEHMVNILTEIKNSGGRLFFLGVGGGAGHASHAVNDFRKICGFESYSPTDNVSELTARINDDGWDSAYAAWLSGSRLQKNDGVFVFSVGGGNREKNVSMNLVRALELAKSRGAKILGVVGRDGGYTASVADACVIIPSLDEAGVTQHTEAFQAVIWHLLVGHPKLKVNEMKWESVL